MPMVYNAGTPQQMPQMGQPFGFVMPNMGGQPMGLQPGQFCQMPFAQPMQCGAQMMPQQEGTPQVMQATTAQMTVVQPHQGIAGPDAAHAGHHGGGGIDSARPPVQPFVVVEFPDDQTKLSTAYKALGMSWQHGERRVTAKRFRCSLCTVCDPDEFPMLKVCSLSCEMVDLLLFCLTGILPNTKVSDMACATKRQAREACARQHRLKIRKNACRLQLLSDELDNLPACALRLGFPPELFSPPLRQQYEAMRVRQQLGNNHFSRQLEVGVEALPPGGESTTRLALEAQCPN